MTERAILTLRLAGCRVEVSADCVDTKLPGGQHVLGMPHHDPSYRKTAREHGYGSDVRRLNRGHEVGHSLLAHWLGMPCSPVFRRVAGGDNEADDLTRAEESAVLALERYANALGLDLVAVAERWSA